MATLPKNRKTTRPKVVPSVASATTRKKTQQDISSSPLAMLAQTCSRIGTDNPGQTMTIKEIEEATELVTSPLVASSNIVAVQSNPTATSTQTVVSNAAANLPTTTNNAITINQDGSGLAVIPNVTLLPHMQSINIGGQEALFIPTQNTAETNTNATVQVGASGQSVKTLQLSNQNAIPVQPLTQGNPIVVQPNGQTVQQVPSFIQIPVSTANGQTIYQTIQIGTVPIPVNTGTVLPPTSTPQVQQSGGIIAAALADSQVQLKPAKKTQNQKGIKTAGDVPLQTNQLVQTSSGYMLVSGGGDGADVKPATNTITPTAITVSAPSKQSDYATLVPVESVEQSSAIVAQLPTVSGSNSSNIAPMPASLQLQQDPQDPTKWVIVNPSSTDPPHPVQLQTEERKVRQKRHACTCPNCKEGGHDRGVTVDGEPKRKQHICHVENCGKVYWKTSHLRAHLRGHTGDRPFVCNWPYCEKKFTRSDELQRHRRTHTGDKKFICDVCDKRFMRSDHLTKHKKTHSTQRLRRQITGGVVESLPSTAAVLPEGISVSSGDATKPVEVMSVVIQQGGKTHPITIAPAPQE